MSILPLLLGIDPLVVLVLTSSRGRLEERGGFVPFPFALPLATLFYQITSKAWTKISAGCANLFVS
jgi:hypothetical protein